MRSGPVFARESITTLKSNRMAMYVEFLTSCGVERTLKVLRTTMIALYALSLCETAAVAADSAQSAHDTRVQLLAESTEQLPVEQPSGDSQSSSEDGTATSPAPLQGKTEVTHFVLHDLSLYKHAVASIEEGDYTRGIYYLEKLVAQLDEEGHEPYKAECIYLEAGCHQKLNRMNAATDKYHEAFELFAKYDSSNPLKDRAGAQYAELKRLKLHSGIAETKLQDRVENRSVAFKPQMAMFAIDPHALLEAKVNESEVLLEVNDRAVLPQIVKKCFSDMSCLETAEIGSNVTNAVERWTPLMVHGRAAAFAMNGSGNPVFRATVNGRSYQFDVILPELGSGQRKVLLVTNLEKICAVDVESFDTWLLRMQRASDGKVTSARWYKLTHKKEPVHSVSPNLKTRQFKRPISNRQW